MKVCIFEDFFIYKLAPVNYLRHTSEIICGAFSIKEKTRNLLPSKSEIVLHSRNYLAEYCREKFSKIKVNEFEDDEFLFLNSRVLFERKNLKEIIERSKNEKDWAIVQDKSVIAFCTSKENSVKIGEVIIHEKAEYLTTLADIEWLELAITEVKDFRLINSPSDLILYHDEEIRKDLSILMKGKKKLYVSPKSKIGKNVVLDTSEGNIYVGKGTYIEPLSYIKGPVYIGEHSLVRSGSGIYGPVSIGNHSKVSGEITCSVIHSYVNKQHLGFLGHSYICEWVNLGAGTTTSNLKNNYSKIKLSIGGEEFDTGSIFLGSIIGDHTKTGIGTMLNTGSLIGISSNLFGSGFHDKQVRSFSWAEAGKNEQIDYDMMKAIEVARISMKRRNIEMSDAYCRAIEHLYESRSKRGV